MNVILNICIGCCNESEHAWRLAYQSACWQRAVTAKQMCISRYIPSGPRVRLRRKGQKQIESVEYLGLLSSLYGFVWLRLSRFSTVQADCVINYITEFAGPVGRQAEIWREPWTLGFVNSVPAALRECWESVRFFSWSHTKGTSWGLSQSRLIWHCLPNRAAKPSNAAWC